MLALPGSTAEAQDTAVTRLSEVLVRATREPARSLLELPFALTSIRPDSSRPGLRLESFDELLLAVPGLLAASRTNPAQDPRIFIRGFGSRSAFGVRGVRIVRDGMPLTLPDGQTPVDYMDLQSVGTIEVIRGAAAALYGNAAGGVIDIRSSEPPADPLAIRLRAAAGSHGLRRATIGLGGTASRIGYQGNASHVRSDGYRRYAEQEATTGFTRVAFTTGATTFALQGLFHRSPLAEDAGALTADQLASDPRMADPLWVARRVRKTVAQGQIGLSATRASARGEGAAILYGGWRSLDNTRPAFVIDLGRRTAGASLRGSVAGRVLGASHRFTTGIDVQTQTDDRRNDANCNGTTVPTPNCPVVGAERGAVLLDQRETVMSAGPFAREELAFGRRYRAIIGARADWIRFAVKDRLVSGANPDDSGERTLRRVSPMVGFVARIGRLQAVYANVSSAFETPTASELTTKPDGSGGLNPQLDPQVATTWEAGAKGWIGAWLRYDAALFTTRVTDELIQYDVPGIPGRSYYRNAGRTSRQGAELGATVAAGPIEAAAAYTFSRFRFVRYVAGATTFDGNRIPGIPTHQAQLGVTWRRGIGFAGAELAAASDAAVDDANASRVAGYGVLGLRGGADLRIGRHRLSPGIGIQNVLDRAYAGTVVVNAGGGKYYEPAPRRTIHVSLTAGAGR